MTVNLRTIICFICLSQSSLLFAQEMSLSIGEAKSRYYFQNRGELSSDTFRLGYISSTDYQWSFNESHKLKLEIEAGVHHWRDAFLEEDKTGVYTTPMWRYYLRESDFQMYFGFGIGLSYTDAEEFMDRKLGSRLLFEDRFEIGAKIYQKHRLSFSINHYSNANLADINHGVNLYYLNYAYLFDSN